MMYLLYALFAAMLALALVLLGWSFRREKTLRSAEFFILAVFTVILSLALYYFIGAHQALAAWVTEGSQHYKLLNEYNKLGGTEGIIRQIEKRLQAHPDDAEGWLILGKLYFSKEDYSHAEAAFQKAHDLKPGDTEIIRYYEISKNALK